MESVLRRQGNVPKPRIQTLADFIFGLALSIGAVSLLSSKPPDTVALMQSISLFSFSFVIIAILWVKYTRVMSVLPLEGDRLLVVNFLMLLMVSIEPYLFSLIAFQPAPGVVDPSVTTSAYAVDLGFMNLAMAYFTNELTKEEKGLISPELLGDYRLQRASSIIVAAVFLVSALPGFSVSTRVLIWTLAMLTYPARRLVSRRPRE